MPHRLARPAERGMFRRLTESLLRLNQLTYGFIAGAAHWTHGRYRPGMASTGARMFRKLDQVVSGGMGVGRTKFAGRYAATQGRRDAERQRCAPTLLPAAPAKSRQTCGFASRLAASAAGKRRCWEE